MKKIINILFCFILTFNFGYSQSIKRNVISSFGSSSNNGNIILESTFGQPANIGTLSDGVFYLRQGFQQPPFQNTIYGCTDPLADNYNANATIDDGSCTYTLYGCTDPTACNYDSLATQDNGSCSYADVSTTYATACNSYTWNNNIYNTSGSYTSNNTGVNGCDSSVILNLTINYSDTSYTNITVCDSYTWNDSTYTQSGTYYSQSSAGNTSHLDINFGEYVEVPNSNSLEVTNSFTVEAWVKVDDFSVNSNNFPPYEDAIMSKVVNGDHYGGFELKCYTGGTILFNGNIGNSNFGVICNVNNNNWNHIACTYDGSLVRMYLNSIYVDSMHASGSLQTSTLPLRFGKRAGAGSYNCYFDGKLDEARIWNIALSHQEIQNFMNCNPTGSEAGLVGYWNFEEGLGSTQVIDQTSNGNDGIIYGASYNTNVPLQSCNLINVSGCDSTAILNLTINPLDGCTDSTAFNYDAGALCDDGSCIYDIYGCTDPTALNYDSTATIDNGSCQYCEITLNNIVNSCNGNNGSISLNINANTAFYLYTLESYVNDSWQFFSSAYSGNSYTFQNLPADTFRVIVTDNNTCVDTLGSISYDLVSAIENMQFTLNPSGIYQDDVHSNPISIGFPFTFYGNTYTECLLASNNYLTFDLYEAGNYSNYLINAPVPNPGTPPENAILAPWQDLNPGLGGSIEYGTYGNAPNRVFISRWNNIPMFQCDTLSFSSYIFLYEKNNKIVTYIEKKPICISWNGGAAIHGLVSENSNNYNIVIDPVANQERNYPLVWTANNETIEFIPDSTSNYNINYNNQTNPILTTIPVTGCTDASAINYTSGATCDDGSCIPVIYGCTDSTALNYNSQANTDDGSCLVCTQNGLVFIVSGGSADSEISWGLTQWNGWASAAGSAGTTYGCVQDDCYIFRMYDAGGDGWNGATYTIFNDSGSILATGTLLSGNYGSDTIQIGNTVQCPILGCTDPTATNYDPNANTDDGSCIACIFGCTGPTSCNYDPLATCDDGSCYGLMGCMDSNACNYNQYACYDDGSCLYPGCTDPLANNYDPSAICDDGSCTYSSCNVIYPITGLYVDGIIDDRAVLHFDNMNTYDANGNQICRVDQIRIKYREVGTSAWSQKNIASPTGYDANGVCNSTQKTDKNLYGLSLATTYEWRVKVWYCSGQVTGWVNGPNFTTLGECPNVGNTNAYGSTPTRATFTWDDSNGVYEFVRIKIRVDSIQNPLLSDFIQVGGTGVTYGTFTKNKNGLTPGQTYRGQGRTWCDPNGGAYNSLGWTPFLPWTQPTNRIDGGDGIKNLDIYPNPSRDVFNISFTSETIQELRVVVRNIVGEELIIDDLQQFIGEYTKKINLKDNAKGIYLLEIETNEGVINKKLILQ